MPQRPFSRTTQWLVPPSLDDWVPRDHPVRFLADVLDGFDAATWERLGVARIPHERGAPRYAPEGLLAVWLYGFSVGIRSSRGLEAACRDQIPFRWLSGNQTPDHNTLFRFLQQHPQATKELYRETVQIALHAGLVDWALQAVDGTKIGANAAVERSVTAEELAAMEEALDTRIATVLAETADRQTRDEAGPPTLPPDLRDAQTRKTRIAQARATLADRGGTKLNRTDPDAVLMKTRQGITPAYNAQAVVTVVAPPADAPAGTPSGRLIVGTTLITAANDLGQLAAMVAEAAAQTGQVAKLTVADKGYFSAATLAVCAEEGLMVAMPEPAFHRHSTAGCFPQSVFTYDEATDTYTCPAGQSLPFRGHLRDGDAELRRYRADRATCLSCPLRDQCTRATRHGRALKVRAGQQAVHAHRAWMATEAARTASRQRGRIVEPVFGVIKEQLNGRRFLRRGLDAVRQEWQFLAAAFNLRTLTRWWQLGGAPIHGTERATS